MLGQDTVTPAVRPVAVNTAGQLAIATLSGEDAGLNIFRTSTKYGYFRVKGATQLLVKGSNGILGTVTVNAPVSAGVITLCDTSANAVTAPTIARINCGPVAANAAGAPFTLTYGVAFTKGLSLNTSAAMDVTIGYL